jgi:signal transduction histidine kinase
MFNSDLVSRIANDLLPVLDEYYEAHPERIIGGLSYLETRKELDGLLKGINIGSQRIRDIVSGLKEFARMDEGNLQQEVRINDVVKSALLIVGNLLRKSTDNFSVMYDEHIPVMPGNVQQIEQVIINLLTNACQALPDRGRAVQVKTEFDKVRDTVHVVVSDEGVGISKDSMKRMFDPFFTTKREQGGTGLGLSVSYNIVQAHKGDLHIESEQGKGTTVTLSLPVTARGEVQ